MKTNTKKTKLSLTVRKDIIENAKRQAKERGVSVSKLFGELFNRDHEKEQKNKKQRPD